MQAIAVERSHNSKLSADDSVSATYVSQVTCPESCPFRGNRCYAERGNTGIHTARLNKAKGRRGTEASQEVDAIRKNLSGKYPIRLHVVGDCKDNYSASMLSLGISGTPKLVNTPVWTYTHAWRNVDRKSWGDVSVIASCETALQASKANYRGYTAVVVADSQPDGPYIQCLNEINKSIKCVDCKLCWQDKMLLSRGLNLFFKFRGKGSGNA